MSNINQFQGEEGVTRARFNQMVQEVNEYRAPTEAGVYTYTHTKSGTAHNLAGSGDTIKFHAVSNFTTGDTFTVNGAAVTARSIDGSSLSTGDFVTGSDVLAGLSGNVLTLVFRSYAGELADRYTKAESDAALSNKAVSSYGILTAGNLLTWAQQQSISGSFAVDPLITTEGTPAPGVWLSGRLEVNVIGQMYTLTVKYTDLSKTLEWTATTGDGVFGPWVQKADAISPQMLYLPLSEGYTQAVETVCGKDQFGFVHVSGTLYKAGTIGEGEAMATFPIGFHPRYNTPVLCMIMDAEGNKEIIGATVWTDGTFRMGSASTLSAFRILFSPFEFLT